MKMDKEVAKAIGFALSDLWELIETKEFNSQQITDFVLEVCHSTMLEPEISNYLVENYIMGRG